MEPFVISLTEKKWLAQTILWLHKKFGFPKDGGKRIELDEIHFPRFSADQGNPVHLMKDISGLLDMGDLDFELEIIKDIRDTVGVPYQMVGKPVNVYITRLDDGKCIAQVANSIRESFDLLLGSIHELTKLKLRLAMDLTEEAFDEKSTKIFLEVAAIYFGFGFLLLNHGSEVEIRSRIFWQTTSTRRTSLSRHKIAYVLSLCFDSSVLTASGKLSKNAQSILAEAAQDLESDIANGGPELLDVKRYYRRRNYEISRTKTFSSTGKFREKALYLDDARKVGLNDRFHGIVCNNLGYCHLRLGDFEKAQSLFFEAIPLIPDEVYLRNNLCLLHLKKGETEAAEKIIRKINLEEKGNDYTRRNQGILLLLLGEYGEAEKIFEALIESGSTVDLVDYYAAVLYLKLNDSGRSEKYRMKSKALNDPEAFPPAKGF